MAEFVSSFITGFQDVVKKNICNFLSNVKIINVYDGIIHYKFDGNSRDIEKIPYFNNTFFVLSSFQGKNVDFSKMVSIQYSKKQFYLINKGTFRVRFSKENQFTKVDKNIARKAEETVLRNSKLSVDRLNPTTEVWYVIRREGFAFCGELLCKREFTEKNLCKGELRPEIAYLMCCFADIEKTDCVLDPFAGYGSIPMQISKHFSFSRLFLSDIDEVKINSLKEKNKLKKENIYISTEDALKLPSIEDNSIDNVITDPPWGYFEDIGNIPLFYSDMFVSLKRVLVKDGKMLILSARTEEFLEAAERNSVIIKEKINTLVNGKKASLFKCIFSSEEN